MDLPEKAVAKAKSLGQEPDFFYISQLLEETGICFVPGSGFGQKPGTYHFRCGHKILYLLYTTLFFINKLYPLLIIYRTTILPQIDKIEMMMEKFRSFHEKFLKAYQ